MTAEINGPVEVIEVVNARGQRGKSAYEVAQDNGFTGTQEEWLASLEPDGSAFATAAQGALADTAVQSADLTAAVDAAVSGLVAGAPGALDTLNELAAALGDDANFAATVSTALAGKQAIATLDADVAAALEAPGSALGASADSRYAASSILGGSVCAILGDSLANNGEGIGYWLAALSKQAISFPSLDYVRSYPGETSTQIAARVSEITGMSVKPRFCLISAGSNDAAGSVSGATYQANMVAIIDALQAAGIRPVLMTTPPRTGVYGLLTEYNLRLRRLANLYGLPIIDAYAVLANPATEQYQAAYNSGDGIHPSPAGCKAVASAALSSLVDVLSRPADLSALASGVNLYPGAAFATDANVDGLADGNSASPSTGLAYSRASDPSGFYWQRMTLTGATGVKQILGITMLAGTGSTTLASSATAGATSLSLVGSASTGGVYKVTNSGGWYEYVKITAVTGSGPYTATLDASTPLKAAHGAGATITPAFAVGDKLALASRFKSGQDSTKFIVQATFYNSSWGVVFNRILTSPNSTAGMTRSISDGLGYSEVTMPAGADRIQFAMQADGATNGTYEFALPFVANLTALGLA